MKKNINFDQWDELTYKQRLRLDSWLMKKYLVSNWQATASRSEYVPRRLVDIGDMIEILLSFAGKDALKHFTITSDICDKLWEEVKKYL